MLFSRLPFLAKRVSLNENVPTREKAGNFLDTGLNYSDVDVICSKLKWGFALRINKLAAFI